MPTPPQHHPVRGILAGVAGGLVASWVMNQFMATIGPRITEAVQTDAEKQQAHAQQKGDSAADDSTMKVADAITATVTGGQHLTHRQKVIGGPVVHYTFGALMGGLYGGLAEFSTLPTTGFGSTFGAVLFTAGDLIGVPAFKLSPPATQMPASTLASPFVAHLVYGGTVELVRRLTRKLL